MYRTSADVPQNTTPQTLLTRFDALRVDLAAQIKRARANQGLSQEGLALAAQIDRTYLSQIERHQTNPSLLVLARIANTLGSELAVTLQPPKACASHAQAYANCLSAALDIVEEVLGEDAGHSPLLERIRLRLVTELTTRIPS